MLNEGFTFAERYLLKLMLGRGGFSEVWLAEDTRSNLDVALKIYAPYGGLDDKGTELFCKEFSLVFNINHTNLLKPTFYDVHERSPYLILPYCSKGSISSLTGCVEKDDLLNIIHDVAAGLDYLHSQEPPVIHQDIKTDNILINDHGDYLITDFGISTKARSTLRRSIMSNESSGGTFAYMGPERFSRTPAPVKASDIWSLGAMAYELVEGNTPFDNMGGVMQKNGAEIPDIQRDIPDEIKTIIYKCLAKETWDRPTAKDIVQWTEKLRNGDSVNIPSQDQPQDQTQNLIQPNVQKTDTIISKIKGAISGQSLLYTVLSAVLIIAIPVAASLIRSAKNRKDDILAAQEKEQAVLLQHRRDSLQRILIDSLDPEAKRTEDSVEIKSVGFLINSAKCCLETEGMVQNGINALKYTVTRGMANNYESASEAAALIAYIYAKRDVESTRTEEYFNLYPDFKLDSVVPQPDSSRKYSGIALELNPKCYKALFERCFDNIFGDIRGFSGFRRGIGSLELYSKGREYAAEAKDTTYVELFDIFHEKYKERMFEDKSGNNENN